MLKSKESVNGGFPDTPKMIQAFIAYSDQKFDMMANKLFDMISDKYFYQFVDQSKNNLELDEEARKAMRDLKI